MWGRARPEARVLLEGDFVPETSTVVLVPEAASRALTKSVDLSDLYACSKITSIYLRQFHCLVKEADVQRGAHRENLGLKGPTMGALVCGV